MSPNVLRVSCFSAPFNKTFNPILTLTIVLSLALASLAQAQSQSQSNPQPGMVGAPAPPGSTITVPAGTSIAAVLTHPIQSRYIRHGDDIYAQVISPVAADNQVVIPAGILMRGTVDRLGRHGDRGELYLQSMSIMYTDGYVAPIAGPITLESDEGYALKDPGKGRGAALIAGPLAGTGLGALIGHSVASSQGTTLTSSIPQGCTPSSPGCLSSSITGPPDKGKDTVIGAAVGGGVGLVAGLLLVGSSHNFFLDVGSPLEMVLPQPLTVERDQVAAATRDAEKRPAREQPVAQRPQPPPPDTNNGTCWTPGTPGTPGTDIPGTPGTPPTPYPCP